MITPESKDPQNKDGLALLSAGEVTVSMTMERYHAIQKNIAEVNWVRGQTKGQENLVHYFYQIIVEESLGIDALDLTKVTLEVREKLRKIFDSLHFGNCKYCMNTRVMPKLDSTGLYAQPKPCPHCTNKKKEK